MDNYTKGEVKDLEDESPFSKEIVLSDVKRMEIQPGTKIKNILSFVHNLFKNEKERQAIFSGFGEACSKTISCVEMFKRQHEGVLYQWNRLCVRRTEEFWEPKIETIDRLKVNRDVPAIYILLSKDALNDVTISSQISSEDLPFCFQSPSVSKRKKPISSVSKSGNKWRRKPRKKITDVD